MSIFRNLLENGFQFCRQAAQTLQLGLVSIQFRLGRQRALEDQVCDFFKFAVFRQILNIVTAVGQAGARNTYSGKCGFTCYLATQACAAEFFCFCHDVSPLNLISANADSVL